MQQTAQLTQARDLRSQYITQEDKHVANKHSKRSLAIKKMQIKIMMRCHYTPTRDA